MADRHLNPFGVALKLRSLTKVRSMEDYWKGVREQQAVLRQISSAPSDYLAATQRFRTLAEIALGFPPPENFWDMQGKSPQEISAELGIGTDVATRINALLTFGKEYADWLDRATISPLRSPLDVQRAMARFFIEADTEVGMVWWLDKKYNVITHQVFKGTEARTPFVPMELLNVRVKYPEIAGMVVGHTHIKQDSAEPSAQDLTLTEQLCVFARMAQVQFLDHVIVSKSQFYSCFREKIIQQIMDEMDGEGYPGKAETWFDKWDSLTKKD